MGKVTPLRTPQARYEAGRPTPYHVGPPQSLQQNAEVQFASPRLRNWSRHLAANSSIVKAVLDSRIVNGIGCGLTYEPLVRDSKGNLLEDLNKQIGRVITNWRKDPDVTGSLSGGELERLLWRSWDMDGEVFLREVIKPNPVGGIPYQVQVIESDWVPMDAFVQRDTIQGVHVDEWGRPTAYSVYKRQPDQGWIYSTVESTELIELPASVVRHLKHISRPNQVRGVPLVHAVVFRVADIAEYSAAHRLAARASADQYMSINRSPEMVVSDTANDRTWQLEHLQIIDELAPGESVNFHDPANPNVDATEFLHEEMRQIAAGTRSSFSQIASVFDRAYAAQRLEIVHAWRLVEQDRSQYIDDVARKALYERPLQVAIDAGVITIPRRGVDRSTLFDVRIDGPVMPQIDPVNDRKADALDQEHGWDSRQAIMRKRGKKPADVDAERDVDEFLEIPEPVVPAPAPKAEEAEDDAD